MSREAVLSMLMEHQQAYVSGESMSKTLGVSRAAVWKAIQTLRQQGYLIESAPKRGYRLDASPDRVRDGELVAPLKGCVVGSSLLCLETIDSTNTEAKRRAVDGAPHGLVILSEEQTAGRGRSFQSPKGCGLYLSALLRPQLEPAEVIDFTAWTAVAVCDGIEKCCGVRPRIKWTNDLVLGGKKLCGILTEMGIEGESHSLEYIVAGIGINVNHQPEDFDDEVADIATSIAQTVGQPIRRATLAVCVIQALDEMYQQFPHAKQKYLDQYRKDCLTTGHRVQLVTPTSRREAMAVAIDDDFKLVVELPDGTRESLSTGEVSVRGMYGYV